MCCAIRAIRTNREIIIYRRDYLMEMGHKTGTGKRGLTNYEVNYAEYQ